MKNSFLLCLLMLAICLGCKQDEPNILQPEIDGCGISSFASVNDQYPIISSPVFNPNNPDEFAFLRDKYFAVCCEQDLMVYNMATKELKKIFQGNIGTLDWSKKDWLLFNDLFFGGIRKIKPTGDSLALVDSFSYAFSLNLAGDQFVYDYYNQADFTTYHRLATLEGEVLKQHSNGLGYYYIWHNDSLLTTLGSDGINAFLSFYSINNYFDVPDTAPFSYANISNIGYVTQYDWMDENTMAFSTEKGIYTVYFPDINSVTTPTQIWKADCPRVGSVRFTVQREAKKLIVQRYEMEKAGETQYIRNGHFVRMNFDGSGEEVIEIPGL
jgi:hypothetical protein